MSSTTDQADQNPPARWMRRRLVTVLLMLVLAVIAGYLLGRYLAGRFRVDLAWAVTAVGAAFLLAAIEQGLGALQAVWRYLRNPVAEPGGLNKVVTYVLGFAAVASFAAFSAFRPATEPEPAVPVQNVLFLQPGGKPRFVVPFLSEARRCTVDGSCEDGLEIEPASRDFLIRLAVGLASCASRSGEVLVEVRGYASSSRFAGSTQSDAWNLTTANLRAGRVRRLLEGAAVSDPQGERVRIVERPWSEFEDMRRAAAFHDLDDAGERYLEERGLLNRRAEILLRDLGACESGYAFEWPPPAG